MISNENISMGELHDQAMELADKAFIAKRHGDLAAAQELHRHAFKLEAQAADLVKDDLSAEPTRSVLYRSAAAMAIDAGELEEARSLIREALSGNPPAEIKIELLGLLTIVLGDSLDTRRDNPWDGNKRPLHLTSREKQVLSLVAIGLKADDIAQHLVINSTTVRNHLANIRHKVGAIEADAIVSVALQRYLNRS
jgi:DNA-binding NarL/FixJ family response regulator